MTGVQTCALPISEAGPVDENGVPIQESNPYGQQYLQVKGTNVYCPVGPAWNPDGADPIEGSGEVFTDNAQAAVLDNGWGVTVDLNDEKAAASHESDPSAFIRVHRRLIPL